MIKHNRHTAVLHVSATREGQDIGRDDIDRWHKNKGWNGIGYHYVIRVDGTLEYGRPLTKNGAHVRGHNRGTIGICVVGGVDENLAPKDTMNPEQHCAVLQLLYELKEGNPKMKVKGHRDYSPDKNNNGVIEPFEFMKACPCYDAEKRFAIYNGPLENIPKP